MADITENQMKIIEKLITDEEFRKSFFEHPDAAIASTGIEISAEETAGLAALDAAKLDAALAELDSRLSKSSFFSTDASSITDMAKSVADKLFFQ
jgi:hypothetical protein